MTTWFTSDLHIGHRLVAGIRGFWTSDGADANIPDTEAHKEAIRQSWSVVRPDDIVWVLGDLCVSVKWWQEALDLIHVLPGRKRLVSGNHDPVSSIHRDAWKYQKEARTVFESVQDFAKIRLNGNTVFLSHYPYSGTGSEGMDDETGEPRSIERYSEFRLHDYGTSLIHGHTHGKEKLHFSDAGTAQVHVGMDAWSMQLVSQYEAEKLLDEAPSSAKVEPRQAFLSR